MNSTAFYVSITFLVHHAVAETHTITVGHYAFTFTSSSLSGVAVGDSIEFQFLVDSTQPTGSGAVEGGGDAGTGSGDSGSEAGSVTGSGWVAGIVGLVGVLAF